MRSNALTPPLLLVLALSTAAAAQPPVALGVEVQVSATPIGVAPSAAVEVGQPRVAVFSDGGFVVVWTVGEPGRTVQHVRIFAGPGGAGAAKSERLLVPADGLQEANSVAALSDNSFVVVYTQVAASGLGVVMAARFKRDGALVVPPFQVHEPSSFSRFGGVVAAGPDPGPDSDSENTAGGFAVAWSAAATESVAPVGIVPYVNAFARRFTAAGQPLGPALLVARGGFANSQVVSAYPTGLAEEGGGTLWVAVTVVAGTSSVELARFDPQGAPLGILTPGPQGCCTTRGAATVKRAADGSVVFAWEADIDGAPGVTTIWAQSYSPKARPLTAAPFLVSGRGTAETNPAVAAFPRGALVAGWTDNGGAGVMGRLFGPFATPLSRPFQIDTNAIAPEPLNDLAANAAGTAVAVWETPTDPRRWVIARSFTPTVPLAAAAAGEAAGGEAAPAAGAGN
jgi:hypothetical protein